MVALRSRCVFVMVAVLLFCGVIFLRDFMCLFVVRGSVVLLVCAFVVLCFCCCAAACFCGVVVLWYSGFVV